MTTFLLVYFYLENINLSSILLSISFKIGKDNCPKKRKKITITIISKKIFLKIRI